jgi:hypothetical protein
MLMRSPTGLAALLALAASSLQAEVEVRVSGELVSLRAVATPVSEILDRLARQTGMKLVYDAPPPRQLLTATLEERSLPEAVLALLEGLGLNYALVMDRAGVRVDQLLILGAAAPAPARAAAAAPPVPRRQLPVVEEVDPDEGDPAEVPDVPEEAAEGEPESAPPPTTGPPLPAPPEYPSSSFTPRLPRPPTLPVAGPSPTPQPTPQAREQ